MGLVQTPGGLVVQHSVRPCDLIQRLESQRAKIDLRTHVLGIISYQFLRHFRVSKYQMTILWSFYDPNCLVPGEKSLHHVLIRLSPTAETQIRYPFYNLGHQQEKNHSPKFYLLQQPTQNPHYPFPLSPPSRSTARGRRLRHVSSPRPTSTRTRRTGGSHSHRIRGRCLVPRPGNIVPIRGSGSKRVSVPFKVGSRPV